MSMVCFLRAVSREQASNLVAAPDQIEAFLFPEDQEVMPPPKLSLWSRIFGGRPPVAVQEPNVEPLNSREIDLDKAWHGLHFLFTGTAWEGAPPECFLVSGGTEIGQVD